MFAIFKYRSGISAIFVWAACGHYSNELTVCGQYTFDLIVHCTGEVFAVILIFVAKTKFACAVIKSNWAFKDSPKLVQVEVLKYLSAKV